jgi:hypothetical protein
MNAKKLLSKSFFPPPPQYILDNPVTSGDADQSNQYFIISETIHKRLSFFQGANNNAIQSH